MGPVRLVIVDDRADMRLLVRLVVGRALDVEVVAEGGSGLDAIALAAEHNPDVIVLDQEMPQLTGLAALAGIRAAAPGARVVLFTSAPPAGGDHPFPPDAIVAKLDGVAALVDVIAAYVIADPRPGRRAGCARAGVERPITPPLMRPREARPHRPTGGCGSPGV